MPVDQDNQDLIKRVTEATLKAISARDDVEVTFAPGAHGISNTPDGIQAMLPTPARQVEKQDLHILRGEADTAALRLRYHNPDVYRRQRPQDHGSSQLFDAAEQARVEAIGCRLLAGVASNLQEFQEASCRERGHHLVNERNDTQIPDAVGLILRERLTGQKSPASSQPLIRLWRPWVEERIGSKVNNLKNSIHNQELFGENLREILEDLDLPVSFDADSDDNLNDNQDQQEQENQESGESESGPDPENGEDQEMEMDFLDPDALEAVSYTHLTLPTILLV